MPVQTAFFNCVHKNKNLETEEFFLQNIVTNIYIRIFFSS